MGMYTQIRGWLNIDSISYFNFDKLEKIFNDAIIEYNSKERTTRQKLAIQDTHILRGGNGSAFIFIGCEMKNYDEDAEEWLKFLISKYYNSEGHICFQYENDKTKNKVWIVSKGKIEERYEDFPFEGYGNTYEEDDEDEKSYNIEELLKGE